MILTHFSKSPIKIDFSRTYNLDQSVEIDPSRLWYKPQGLWVSDEKDHGWKYWCEAEKFRLFGLKYQVNVKVDCKEVLVLSTLANIKKFTKKYRRNFFPGLFGFRGGDGIDWLKVSEKYKGIIITPYQWDIRLDLDHFWYYGWDCASGCIWDLSCIELV